MLLQREALIVFEALGIDTAGFHNTWLLTCYRIVLPFGPPRAWNVKVAQLHPTLCHPKDYIIHGILQARILEWIAVPFSRGSSQPRDRNQSPTLQVDSFPAEPQRKPKNTGVGSLSLLQEIYPTQESNQRLLHCRWILYQLSYQGSHQSLKDLKQLCSLRAKITKQSLTERVWVLGPPETLRDKEGTSGTSLAVQGLRLHASSASTAGIAGPSLVWELRSHMLHDAGRGGSGNLQHWVVRRAPSQLTVDCNVPGA